MGGTSAPWALVVVRDVGPDRRLKGVCTGQGAAGSRGMDVEAREMTFLACGDLSSWFIVDSGTHDGGSGRVGCS